MGPLYIDLPCKPMVYQYLVNLYPRMDAAGVDALIDLPAGDPQLLILYTLLQRNHSHDDAKYTLQYYSRKVRIPVQFEVYERMGIHLSKTAIVAINKRIEDLITERLDMILQFYTSLGYQLKDAIQIFRTAYNFPEEAYSFDAIQKRWQRHTKKSPTVHNIIGETVRQRQKGILRA
ncbi:MAG: hypothetical protein JSS76_08345 [Bacteroidetes bacterium]|nr:hypothetical protein [Bacteroidota bacterium]